MARDPVVKEDANELDPIIEKRIADYLSTERLLDKVDEILWIENLQPAAIR